MRIARLLLTLGLLGPACDGSDRSAAGVGASRDGGSSGSSSGGSSGSSSGGSSGSSSGGNGPASGRVDSGSDADRVVPPAPPTCRSPNQALPPDAPALMPGVWTAVNGSLPFHSSKIVVQGMAIDPCNAATLYVCVGENPLTGLGGVWRSTNAGKSWTKLGPTTNPNHVRVDPDDPLHLYVTDGVNGSTQGLWVTTDGGQAWFQPEEFVKLADGVHTRDTYGVHVDPADFKHLLVSFHSNWNNGRTAGIFESFDGGTTFKVIPVTAQEGGEGYGVFFLYEPKLGIGDSRTWLYAPQSQGMYRTTNGGMSWTKVTDIPMTHGGGQLYYTKDRTLYMGAASGVIKSVDNGETWTAVGDRRGFIGIVGDGKRVYTAPFNGSGTTYISSPENDGNQWTPFVGQIAEGGSFEMAYDAANRIVYSATLWDGVVALKLAD